jgi:hypothetical protein
VNAPPACDGRTAVGRCYKRALYSVNDERACGVHLAQVVKFHLSFHTEVVVREISRG